MRGSKDALFTSARDGSGKDEYITPPWLFSFLNGQFGPFTLDAAADASNALCDEFYDGSPGSDGLTETWDGIVWCNPPYSGLGKWLKKGYDSVFAAKTATRVVMLIPARTDTKAFQAYAPQAVVFLLKGRLRFGDTKHCAPFPSAVLVFDRDLPPSVHFVDWRPA